MTTLATNTPRAYEGGHINEFPSVAADITYEGAAVGLVASAGTAGPLAAGTIFGGFATEKCDNSAGAAGDKRVRVVERGKIELTVAGVVITDIRQPVYATDDDTFTLNPVGGVFIGFVHRWVSSGVAVVEFDAVAFRDPYGDGSVRETISADKTLDAEDSGKIFFVDTDAKTITLPATGAGLACKIVNIGSFGAVAVTVSPNASDKILGPDITSADDKDLINTKATARRGDFIEIIDSDADGYVVKALRGVWARQA